MADAATAPLAACPRCRAPLVTKTGRSGAWQECSKRPACRFKQDVGRPEHAAKPAPPKPLGYRPGCLPLPAGIVLPGALALDEHQQRASAWREGLAVVAASAGSGKTTLLCERVCDLLAEGWVPEAIALLAYNRDAAETIRQRLAVRLGRAADRVDIFTFHAFCYALLRHWYPAEARLSRGRILGTPEAPHPVKLAAQLIDELKLGISWGAALDCASRCAEALVDLDVQGASIELARCMGWAPRTGEIAADVAMKAAKFHRFCLAWRERKQREGLIEFSDMLGEVALAMRRHPETLAYLGRLYSHVMVDEAQDGAVSRIEIARFLGREARSLMFVGDLRQCQPAGTMVLTPDGEHAIETLRTGDEVCAWIRGDKTVQRIGSRVEVAQRFYSGMLTQITTRSGRQTVTTDTHRWLVRWNPEIRQELTAVYVMRKYLPECGVCYRVGWCKVIDESAGRAFAHYKQRMRLEEAEAIWLVKVTKTRAEASAWESIIASRYGIPTVMFLSKPATALYTPEVLGLVWRECAVASRVGAERLFLDFNLSVAHPFHQDSESRPGRQTLFETAACNLCEGLMVPVQQGRTYEWEPVEAIQRTACEDLPVWSMDVANYGAYVADGICTLNSIYGFSGARPDLFMDLAHDPAATLLTLPVNRRSTQRIVEAANAVADGEPWNLGGACVARPGAPVGEVVRTWVQASPSEEAQDVIADIQRRVGAGRGMGTVADPTYCCLARTNAMLVSLEHAFVARNVPCRLAGSPGGVWASEVGEQMLQYLEAVEGVPSFGAVKIANHPKRFAKKAEVGEAVEQARDAEQRGQKPMLHARLEAKGGGAGRLGRDLARAAALSWNRRVLQCARWLGLDDVEEVDGDDDRRACLEALVSLTQQLGSLSAIYDFKTAAARGEKGPTVLLSTIHRGKGQEWPVVYVCGVRAKALPHQKCEDTAEEKRLLYVAVTRARDVLVLSTGGKASEFLVELGWAEEAD
jgi:superfamily I DNA/RNA helicase